MNYEQNTFDKELYLVLKKTFFLIPRSKNEFKKLGKKITMNSNNDPARFKDLETFINSNPKFKLTIKEESNLSSAFAQAAREGKPISDEIKKRMSEDKKNNTK